MVRAGMFLGDRYEILEKIGSGGMSDVYRAKDHRLNRDVAVKVLKQEFNSDRTFSASSLVWYTGTSNEGSFLRRYK